MGTDQQKLIYEASLPIIGALQASFQNGVLKEIHFLNPDHSTASNPAPNCLIPLSEFFEGKRRDINIRYSLEGTKFQKDVWAQIAKIPFGETRTYKQLAQSIGKPKAYRAVANACGANPLPLLIPCHRVIASNGGLGGFSYGVPLKKKLLLFEQKNQCL